VWKGGGIGRKKKGGVVAAGGSAQEVEKGGRHLESVQAQAK